MHHSPQPPASQTEFIVLVALLTAMVAMSIDAMLPAVGTIAHELGAPNSNDRQLIITTFILGLTIGSLLWGPVSDSIGRKPAILTGLLFYAAACLICVAAADFRTILIGRTVQGIAAAGPRIVAIAMVRDGQAGAAMARIMSFVMSVFMLVPILAPSLGQLVLFAASWRFIFVGYITMAVIAAVWLTLRQRETLHPKDRIKFTPAAFGSAGREVLRNPVTIGYTLASGFVFAILISYLSTSQQIFGEQYKQGERFALWFGALAIPLALSSLVNARLVMRYGMQTLSKRAIITVSGLAAVLLVTSLLTAGHPPLWFLGLALFGFFFNIGFLFGNYNALAMEPMGHIAGMAASISGALANLVAVSVGSVIGWCYNGTVIPLALGFVSCGILAYSLTQWAERRR